MATKKMPLAALQAPCAYKRNKYRNLAIEYYARNSSSVLALTHERWPQGAWFSFSELRAVIQSEVWLGSGCSLVAQAIAKGETI